MKHTQTSGISSPPRPQPRQSPPSQTRTRRLNSLLLPQRPFLTANTGDNLVNIRLYHHAANNHLTEHSMHSLIPEDEVQLADILEHAVQCLHEDLDEIYEREW